MKKLILLSVLSLAFSANARGYKKTVFDCNSTLSEFGYSLTISYDLGPNGARETIDFVKKNNDMGAAVSVDVKQVLSFASGDSSYTQYRSNEGNGIGYLSVTKVSDGLIINARIGSTIGGGIQIDTMGPVNLSKDFSCTF